MAKKPKCPEFENHERWLVAYADMMTLLFALFVVLYSITNLEIEKLKSVSKSIQKAFGFESEAVEGATGFPSGNSRTEGIFSKSRGNTSRDALAIRNRRELAAIIAADTKALEKKISDGLQGAKEYPAVSGQGDDRVVYFARDADGIRITLLARGFFLPSQSALEPGSRKVLDGIAAAVKNLGKVIRIEGHTDNRAFFKDGNTNWELSATRAASVVRYFIGQHRFSPQSIYAAGFADTQPIAPNDTPEHRAMNRRVDIKILYDNPSDYVSPDKLENGKESKETIEEKSGAESSSEEKPQQKDTKNTEKPESAEKH